MKGDKKLVPKRRFRVFENSGDWEHRKVGELCEIVAGGTPSTINEKYWNPGLIPWLSSGEVHKKRIYYTDNMISQEGFDNSSAKWVKLNSVLIALAGQGKTRGTVAINSIQLTTNQSIAAMVPTDRLSYEYLFQNLQSRYEELRMLSSADGSRGGLNKQMVSDITIRIPDIEEQIQIGIFLKGLDNLITLHQHKLKKLKDLKSAYLSDMFPKEGEKYPKIRFEGFTEDWQTFKLEELGHFKSNGVNKKINPNEIIVNLLNYMDVYNRKHLNNVNRIELMEVTATPKQIQENNVLKNDVFFTPTSETADDIGRVLVIEEDLKNTVYSYHLMRFRPRENVFYSIFPNYVFETSSFRGQLTFEAQGVQRFVLNRNSFENLLVTMPEFKEQMLISEFFRKIDNLITLNQEKLEKLQNLKKAYLNEMLI